MKSKASSVQRTRPDPSSVTCQQGGLRLVSSLRKPLSYLTFKWGDASNGKGLEREHTERAQHSACDLVSTSIQVRC